MTRILVVDDQDLVRAGIAALLRGAPAGYEVLEASDGTEAIAKAATDLPDVILMDIRMPGTDGITATREILARATEPPPRVLVLTTFDIDDYVVAALRSGASGFLLKTTPADRLFAAIESVAVGDLAFTPAITLRLIEAYAAQSARLAEPTETAPAAPPPDDLTSRERDVLRLVAAGRSNTDIAGALVVAEATVKSHLHRAMTKLSLTSRAQAVVYAYESGLVTPGTARGRAGTPPQGGGSRLQPG